MAMPRAEQTPNNNSQNAPPTTTNQDQKKQEVTLELHKYILLLASLVATVTYAAGFSPPGGVWQDTAAGHLAGDPVIRGTHYKRYLAFFYCNATAFAASLVVIVITLILAYLDDNKHKYYSDDSTSSSSSTIVGRQYRKKPWIAVRTLQAAMVLDLLSLMAAYAAGTCRDTFTTIYSSLLVGLVFFFLVIQIAVAVRNTAKEEQAPPPQLPLPEEKEKEKKEKEKKEKEKKEKEKDRLRKVLMLLATFAVSITYLAGLNTPGGFWDSAGAGHRPGDAILKDRHGTRLAVFFGFNTMAFGASLIIIVVLLDRQLRERNAYGFIVVALVSLIGAYNAGSCRNSDTTGYVFSLIVAVVLYISFLYAVASRIDDTWKAVKELVRTIMKKKKDDAQAKEKVPTTDKEKAADKARSLVLLLATLAATITYQGGLDPPGGVWQDNSGGGHTAGDPILLTTNPRRYKAFFYCNSVSLVASLVAIVLAQKKLLLKHHVLEAVMILDLFGLIGAYAAGSCRDVNTSIHAMALAGAVLVYVVIHVVFITLDDDRRTRTDSEREEESKLVEKTRKRLLLFAILAATITYQAGLTPPGGFLLQDDDGAGHRHHAAGDPVLLYNFPRRYKAFFYCNSVSFMLSIALIILLVNPNVYRPAIRTHALSVCTAAGLFGLMGAYAAGSTQHLKTSFYVFALVAVVIFFILLLFLVFWITSCHRRKATSQGAAMESDTDSTQYTKEEEEEKNKLKRIHANRKYLMLLGILVASVTYQAGLKPPGGAWQSNSSSSSTTGGYYEAGNPVMHDNRRHRYLAFFYSNSTSFMASVVVILLLLVPPKNLFGKDNEIRLNRWLVVMNTTIVLDLLGLLGAYAAGSSRRWKTSVYVLLLVFGVLIYMGFHLCLSYIIRKRSRQSA